MQISPVLSGAQDRTALWEKAEQLEAAFLAEMLRHAGISGQPGAFGGGIGEEQFSSFMRDAQAKAMVEAGGIGLAEKLFQTLLERAGE